MEGRSGFWSAITRYCKAPKIMAPTEENAHQKMSLGAVFIHILVATLFLSSDGGSAYPSLPADQFLGISPEGSSLPPGLLFLLRLLAGLRVTLLAQLWYLIENSVIPRCHILQVLGFYQVQGRHKEFHESSAQWRLLWLSGRHGRARFCFSWFIHSPFWFWCDVQKIEFLICQITLYTGALHCSPFHLTRDYYQLTESIL